MKKKNNILSINQARILALKSQALLSNNFGKDKDATLSAIEHLGYVQIDTLSVVARSHHHTLWSRLPDYSEKYIGELLEKDKAIFEYWSHAASYLPMSNYRFSLILKKAYSDGKSHWFGQDLKMKEYVLDRIKSEGELQSKDFGHKKGNDAGWYEWKPAKRALEQLFMEGKLMIAKRKGFQKVYDLTERVLPANINTTLPSGEEYAEYLIKKSIMSHGFVHESEITYLRNNLKDSVKKVFKRMLEDGELEEIYIENLEKIPFITTNIQLKSVEKFKEQNTVNIISPFDNSIIQRKRVQRIFNFDYIIECYLPEQKRKFGYFSLPVLYGDKFVARFDPKADRASQIFYIKTIHFEEDFKPTEEFNILFSSKLRDFAMFNGCTKIIIQEAEQNWKKAINYLI